MHTRNFHLTQFAVLCILVLSFSSFEVATSNVIGFDLGTKFFKITLVKPGQPFSIVENTATKRKTETMVTFTQDTRLFGADSYIEQTKYPLNSFGAMHKYLGQSYDMEFVENQRKQRFLLNEIVEDDRGLIGWKVKKNPKDSEEEPDIFYTEELIAMILKYGKKLSETQAGGTVRDCVITIPSYFDYIQRKMMIDAAELAGLSVLQLVHENTAAATMYGVDRNDTAQDHYVLFYNMGGTDTEVSVVKYSTMADPSQQNKIFEHVEILAEASDSHLGGEDLDFVLLNMLAERFNNLKER